MFGHGVPNALFEPMLHRYRHISRRLTLAICAMVVAAAAIMHVDLASAVAFQDVQFISSDTSRKPDATAAMERCHSCAVPGDIEHPAGEFMAEPIRDIPHGRGLALVAFEHGLSAPPPRA